MFFKVFDVIMYLFMILPTGEQEKRFVKVLSSQKFIVNSIFNGLYCMIDSSL